VRRDSYTASLKRPSPVWLHRARAQRRAATEAVVPPPFRPTLVAADPTARPVVPHWLRLVLVAFICLGAFFRCYHLDRKVLWEDEIFATVHMLGYTEGEIVAAAPQMRIAADLQRYFHLPDAPPGWPHALIDPIRSLASEDPQHPPLYYVVGRQWAGIFGTSVMALRSLPALFGLLVLPCMYFLCREVFAARGAGLLGAALVAVSPFHVLYAQEVREYSLWTVVLLLLGLAFLRALRRPAAVSWALYGLTVACSMYVFPFSALVAVAQGVYLFALRGFRIDRVATGYLVAAVLGLAAFVPWLAIMIQAAGLARGMSAIFETHVGPLTVIGTLLRNVRGTFVDFATLDGAQFRADRRHRRIGRVCACNPDPQLEPQRRTLRHTLVGSPDAAHSGSRSVLRGRLGQSIAVLHSALPRRRTNDRCPYAIAVSGAIAAYADCGEYYYRSFTEFAGADVVEQRLRTKPNGCRSRQHGS
jgi:hypothetical protein